MFVFLLTLGFVFTFTPQVIAPYDGQTQPVVADRIGDELAGSILADPSTTGGLDEACAVAIFVDDATVDCPTVSEPLADELAIERHRFNVRLVESSGDPVCANQTNITTCDAPDANPLTTGSAVPEGGTSVVTTRRLLHLDDQDIVIEVRVWQY